MKILMVSAECAPIAKVGGLADVVGALPKALIKLGVEVRVMIPFYGSISKDQASAKLLADDISVQTGGGEEKISLWESNEKRSGLKILLIKHRFFNHKEIYLGGRVGNVKKYSRIEADVKRFAFFSLAALAATETLKWKPDVIHCHDWHAALIPGCLKTIHKNNEFFKNTKTLFTIHNLANQGIVGPEILGYTGLGDNLPSIKDDRSDGSINFMAQGILTADRINTVSPTYSKEILRPEQGADLEKVLASRRSRLSGIINGVDQAEFDPKTDKLIQANYDARSLSKKLENKVKLQSMVGAAQDTAIPLVGLVSRIVWQKGLDLITEKLLELPCQFVLLGSGDPSLEQKLLTLAKKYPSKFYVKIGFDLKLAQMIYAGADIFLMPSRFEPCGLSQLISMRYGTIPVVRRTGGLADTVKSTRGFLFDGYNVDSLYESLKLAIDTYSKNPKKWLKLQINSMEHDCSWSKSAHAYLNLYDKLINS